MSQDLKCKFGMHKYVILEESPIYRIGTELTVAKAIVCRCENCGKINTTIIKLTTADY